MIWTMRSSRADSLPCRDLGPIFFQQVLNIVVGKDLFDPFHDPNRILGKIHDTFKDQVVSFASTTPMSSKVRQAWWFHPRARPCSWMPARA